MNRFVAAFALFCACMAPPANAATYVYQHFVSLGKKLTLDGEPVERVDLRKGADFYFTFLFDGPGFLGGDNPINYLAVVNFRSRITFRLIPEREIGGGLQLYGNVATSDLNILAQRSPLHVTYKIGQICAPFCPPEYHSTLIDDLQGSGYDKRSSTYHVTVSNIPIPASGALLLFGIAGILAISRRRR